MHILYIHTYVHICMHVSIADITFGGIHLRHIGMFSHNFAL